VTGVEVNDRAQNARVEDVAINRGHKEQFGEAEYTSARCITVARVDFLTKSRSAGPNSRAVKALGLPIWMLPLNHTNNVQTSMSA